MQAKLQAGVVPQLARPRPCLGPKARWSPCRRAMGLWREGSWLDAVDKRISSLVFGLRLPALLELLLAVPGAFMGFPHAFLGPTPLALAWLASSGPATFLRNMAAVSLAGGLIGFFGGLMGTFDFRQATKVMLLAMPAFAIWALFRPGVEAAARNVGLLSITAAALAVAVCIPLKAVANRLRPAVSLKLVFKAKDTRLPMLLRYIKAMCAGGQANESLPSSDAAVMAANATLLCMAWAYPEPWPQRLALCFVALCCLGRMYFWAHHLLDVACGSAVGYALVLGLRSYGLGGRLPDVLIALSVFLASLLFMQWRTRVFAKDQAEELRRALLKK